MDPLVEAFERDLLRSDDYGVPALVEVVGSVDRGLDFPLDGDAADVNSHLALRREAERGSEFVAID